MNICPLIMILKYIAPTFLLFLLLAIIASPAHAQNSRLYFAGYLGLSTFPTQDFSESTSGYSGTANFDNTRSFAGALGLRLNRNIRVEGEVSYRNANFDRLHINNEGRFDSGGEVRTWLYMANLYYDFDTGWNRFTPFVSAGLGLAAHDVTILDGSGLMTDASDTSYNLAWQLGGGVRYLMSDQVAISGNYRYVGSTDMKIDSYDLGFSSHELRIGLEYSLPAGWFR